MDSGVQNQKWKCHLLMVKENLAASCQKEEKANIFEEMLYRVVRNVAFVWPPLS